MRVIEGQTRLNPISILATTLILLTNQPTHTNTSNPIYKNLITWDIIEPNTNPNHPFATVTKLKGWTAQSNPVWNPSETHPNCPYSKYSNPRKGSYPSIT